MIYRSATETILKNLTVFPAGNIIGPRQVGKTTLAQYLQTRLDKPSVYLDLQPAYRYVVVPAGESYPKEGGVRVVNLHDFLNTEIRL